MQKQGLKGEPVRRVLGQNGLRVRYWKRRPTVSKGKAGPSRAERKRGRPHSGTFKPGKRVDFIQSDLSLSYFHDLYQSFFVSFFNCCFHSVIQMTHSRPPSALHYRSSEAANALETFAILPD